ncbi:MAG: methyl-accepting chemotaxis protein [Euryarchaeota archaeon]|nr:methyl-accepting chemotaxis protein [Euryarchaeota archaeon]
MKLGNMKVGPKLFAGFGIVLVLTAALGIVAFLQIGTMSDQSDMMGSAADLKAEMKTVRQQEKNYIMREDQASIDKNNEALAKVKSLATELAGMVQTVESKAAVEEVKTTIPKYESAFDELQALTDTKEEQIAAVRGNARDLESIIRGSSADQATKDAMIINMLTIRRARKDYIIKGDEKYVTQVSEELNNLKADADAAAITEAEKSAIKTGADKSLKLFSAYVSTTKDVAEIQSTDGPLVQSGRGIDAAATTLLGNAEADSAKAASTATMFVIAFIIAAIAVGVGIAVVVTRSIVGPVTEVVRVMKNFAAGKLGTRAETKASGELLEMTNTLNRFGDDLQGIIKDIGKVTGNMAAGDLNADFTAETPGEFNEIRDNINQANASLSDLIGELGGAVENVASVGKESASSVEQVNSGMQQISSASQQIAKGAQETSGTVNESAKEIKDTNAVLQQVQSHAEESNKFAVESAENAKEMNEAAKKSAEGMKEIQEAIGDTVEVIKNLGSSLEQVGKTTEMIESIADQTNLLALNAAIEAARAGEHGRGFAVVAEEVRKLAENSRQSTAEIDTMISSLQEEMEKVIKATDSVTQRADVGREDLDKVVESVEKTAGMIRDIKGRMGQITEGARKGAESIDKVSKGVDEIASSSEESASSSEESSSAVEEQTAAIEQLSGGMQKLSEIADQATEMIGKFKLNENGGKKQE